MLVNSPNLPPIYHCLHLQLYTLEISIPANFQAMPSRFKIKLTSLVSIHFISDMYDKAIE